MSLDFCDSFAGKVHYDGISEYAFDPDMTDLAELLSGSFTPTYETNPAPDGPNELFSERSTLLADLTELLCDSLIPLCGGDALAGKASSALLSDSLLQIPGKESQAVVTQAKPVRRAIKSRKNAVSKTGFRKGMSVMQALGASDQKPNMSRRRPTSVLVAFPAFDKCDSLLYFPTTLIRLFNSDDMDAASKLMNKYFDKDCKVTVLGKNVFELSAQGFKQLVAKGNEIEPDRIMCVHSTKVIENQIISSIYVKFTDVQPLYAILSRTSKVFEDEGIVSSGMYPDRARRFQHFADELSHNEQVTQDLIAYSQLEDDILIYMRIDFTLTIGDTTRKILHFTHAYEVTSVHIAGADVVTNSK